MLAASVLASWLFSLLHFPSPPLFGALFAGMLYAVSGRGPTLDLPRAGSVAGQALIGISMGSLLDLATLKALGGNWLPIGAVTLATLLLSLLLGQLFARLGGLSRATGTFSTIAGGASGITAIARELGADDRITSVVQYLRVVLILVGMPVVTATLFRPPHDASSSAAPVAHAAWWADLLFVAASAAVGIGLARLVRFPSGHLLGPLLVASILTISGVLGPAAEPAWLAAVGFALVGLQVGLRFTRASLRQVGRLLPLSVAMILLVVLGSAALGVVLAQFTGVPQLDAYLATTPGGLYAVLATAAASGANVTFVLAVQVVRLVLVLASAPLLARWFRGHPGRWERAA